MCPSHRYTRMHSPLIRSFLPHKLRLLIEELQAGWYPSSRHSQQYPALMVWQHCQITIAWITHENPSSVSPPSRQMQQGACWQRWESSDLGKAQNSTKTFVRLLVTVQGPWTIVEWKCRLYYPKKIFMCFHRMTCFHTMTPRIPAPAAVLLTSPKHDFNDFLTMINSSMPTSCFEANWKWSLGIKVWKGDKDRTLTFTYLTPFSPNAAKMAWHHASSLVVLEE